MLRVGILGATGYAGEELIKILLKHPKVKITYLAAKVDAPQEIAKIFPHFAGKIRLICDSLNINTAIRLCDLIFLALPHTVSMQVAPKFLAAGKKVIDLSADYRLRDISVYKAWYNTSHKDKKNLSAAVYGLPEFYREKIKKACLVANPGCYPTAAILAIAPVVVSEAVDLKSIIIDAKSGLTGAGRKASFDYFFSEINENVLAYKINSHQHMPEINQELTRLTRSKVKVNFIPQIVPLNRGILETIYIKLNNDATAASLISLYRKFYKNEPFIRIKNEGELPTLKDVVSTNFCDIGIKFVKENKLMIIVSCIDNLTKGAAGQAVQNMNIMFDFGETTSLL
ncbi:MAG: N-acetyl-gamma-glutamyl-phosphate reductase [Candidatus Omnitrophota bacterium]